VFTLTGSLLRVLPTPVSGRAGSLCIDNLSDVANGMIPLLYVTDVNNHCVWILQRDTGEVKARLPPLPASMLNKSTSIPACKPSRENGHFNHPNGICATRDYIAVCDTGNNRIQVIISDVMSLTMIATNFILSIYSYSIVMRHMTTFVHLV
jgi:hypothetical protein